MNQSKMISWENLSLSVTASLTEKNYHCIGIKFREIFYCKTNNNLVQFIRYGLVSGLALVVDFGALILMTAAFNVYYLYSAALAFLFGLVTNYTLSILWVFNRRAISSWYAEFAIFALVGIGALLLTELVMWSLTEIMSFHYVISKTFATAVSFCWNFLCRKTILFGGFQK